MARPLARAGRRALRRRLRRREHWTFRVVLSRGAARGCVCVSPPLPRWRSATNASCPSVGSLSGWDLWSLPSSSTLAVGGVWAALLSVNLAITPAIPWVIVAMGLLSLAALAVHGRRGMAPEQCPDAAPRPPVQFGVCPGIRAGPSSPARCRSCPLIGFWIVLSQLVKVPGNRLPRLLLPIRYSPWRSSW